MSKELAKTYDPKGIEDRIYQNWLDKKYFHAEVERSKKPFSCIWDMHWTIPCRIS